MRGGGEEEEEEEVWEGEGELAAIDEGGSGGRGGRGEERARKAGRRREGEARMREVTIMILTMDISEF